MTINVNKKKSSSRPYIFHCSEEWKYKIYIFTSENITFSKYAFYFINNSLSFITLYIIKMSYAHWVKNSPYFGSNKGATIRFFCGGRVWGRVGKGEGRKILWNKKKDPLLPAKKKKKKNS